MSRKRFRDNSTPLPDPSSAVVKRERRVGSEESRLVVVPAKKASELAIVPVPSGVKQKVLNEEEYVAGIAHIIQRDFFPETSTLNNVAAALSGGNEGVGYDEDLDYDPGPWNPDSVNVRGWEEAPSTSDRLGMSSGGSGGDGGGVEEAKKLSLDEWMARHTSEDNESFNRLQAEEEARLAPIRAAWQSGKRKSDLDAAAKAAKMPPPRRITAREAAVLRGKTSDEASKAGVEAEVDSGSDEGKGHDADDKDKLPGPNDRPRLEWKKHEGANALMFGPKAQKSQPMYSGGIVTNVPGLAAPRRRTNTAATRFHRDPHADVSGAGDDRSSTSSVITSAAIDSVLANPKRAAALGLPPLPAGADAEAVNAWKEAVRAMEGSRASVSLTSLFATPSHAMGVPESPKINGWSLLETPTPVRNEREEAEERRERRRARRDKQGAEFRIPAPSAREKQLYSMTEAAARAHRANFVSKGSLTPGAGMSGLQGRAQALSPAAVKLAQNRLKMTPRPSSSTGSLRAAYASPFVIGGQSRSSSSSSRSRSGTTPAGSRTPAGWTPQRD